MSNPILSICIITYQQEKYIHECIKGALIQNFNAHFEIVIGEDCSTDDTRNICLEYAKKYPDIIRLICNNTNLGMMGNWINTLNACNGKYIAICEGDDYWTDPYKLQKQVDFLEANPDYTICFHLVENIYQDLAKKSFIFPQKNLQKNTYDVYDLIRSYFINTCSVMYRWQFYNKTLPGWVANHMLGDYQLHFLHAIQGKIAMIPEVMAKYRIHNLGIWSGTSGKSAVEKNNDIISMLNDFSDYTEGRYKEVIDNRINQYKMILLHYYLNNNITSNSKEIYKSIKNKITKSERFKYLLHYYFPKIYTFLFNLMKHYINLKNR